MAPIYLDHAATTPLDARVLDAMLPYFSNQYGNPSSVHQLGRKARHAVEDCRTRIAKILGAAPGEIVFTSGGTESDNLALRSISALERKKLITSNAEHDAVLETAEHLAHSGEDVSILPVGPEGAITPDQLEKVLCQSKRSALVSLMYVNNEIGTVTAIRDIEQLCSDYGAVFHTDAVQAAGLFTLDVDELGVDMLSLSAHKVYGPKGVGLLYVRGGLDLSPQICGGGQERERRSGTENVPSVVGMTKALEQAASTRKDEYDRLQSLRGTFVDLLHHQLDVPFVINGATDPESQAPHIVNVAFPADEPAVDGEMLLLNMDMEGVCVSSGSACASGAVSPSHVLRAIGHDKATASAAVRFSMGASTTREEIEQAATALGRVLDRMTKKLA